MCTFTSKSSWTSTYIPPNTRRGIRMVFLQGEDKAKIDYYKKGQQIEIKY